MNSSRGKRIFEELMAAEGAALHRLTAAYEASPTGRQDLFQEIALSIWIALPRYRGDSSLRTFVYRIAHNQGLRHASRAARDKSRTGQRVDEPADRSDLDADLERQRKVEKLRAAIRQLPLLLRQAIVLYLEDLPAKEIADILGTTVNAVLIRLSRARSQLRTILEKANHDDG